MYGTFGPKKVRTQPQATVDLPSVVESRTDPVALRPEPAMPQINPSPVPPPVALPRGEEVRIEAPPVRRAARKSAVTVYRSSAAKRKSASAKAAPTNGLKYANPWKSEGVSGRMVRIGAYGSLEKGKKAWSQLAELSPSFKRLPAVVTDLPSRTGRIYYWLQVGTTSQAHSEVLCQRMRAIGQSCLVVDLPGARKGSGDERQPVSL
jgi:hypothetical protein